MQDMTFCINIREPSANTSNQPARNNSTVSTTDAGSIPLHGDIACFRGSGWPAGSGIRKMLCRAERIRILNLQQVILDAIPKAVRIAVGDLPDLGQRCHPTTICETLALRTFSSTTRSVIDVILPTNHSRVLRNSATRPVGLRK